jgi:hypothetical protein
MAVISRPVPHGWQIGRDALSKASPHGWFLDATVDEVYPRGVASVAVAVPALIPTSSNIAVPGALGTGLAGIFAVSGSPQPDGVEAVGIIGNWLVRVDALPVAGGLSATAQVAALSITIHCSPVVPGAVGTGVAAAPFFGVSSNQSCFSVSATGMAGSYGYGIGVNVPAPGASMEGLIADPLAIVDHARRLSGLAAFCLPGEVVEPPIFRWF